MLKFPISSFLIVPILCLCDINLDIFGFWTKQNM